MANYYTIVTAENGLKCTPDEAEAIQLLLDQSDDDDEIHGFTFEYEDGSGYLLAEECGTWDSLPLEALVLIGKLIEPNGLSYLECGAAFSCSKLRAGSHGGTAFRIHPDGSIEDAKVIWPSDGPVTQISDKELATVLYALRQIQKQVETPESRLLLAVDCELFTEESPLSPEQIDALCERLNTVERIHETESNPKIKS